MFAPRVLGAIVLTAILFATRGYSQCYSDANCTGNVIPATDRKDCCVRTEDGLSFSDGGTCRGCIVHGFPQTVYNVNESTGIGDQSREGRLDTVFQLNVKGNGDPFPIAGIITAEEDGATVDDDFERLTPIPVDFDLNTDSVNILLFMENDDISLEYNEAIILRFTSPDDPTLFDDLEALGQYIRDTARVNIIDNDQLQINFAQSDYEFEEGSTQGTRILLRFRTVQNPFTITIRPVDIDYIERKSLSSFINFMDPNIDARATTGVDFSSMAMTFTVPGNADDFDISNSFTVVDDDINEIDQSFALVAELGPDVPDDLACFQIRAGTTECLGRLGATEIKITDNDDMVIGFQQRYLTVCENGTDPGDDTFSVPIGVESNITSEQDYTVQFRVLRTTPPGSQRASVGPLLSSNIRDFDVIFGNEENNVIRDSRQLIAGNQELSASLSAAIVNDFISEKLECFTMRIVTTDIGGVRSVFNCTSDTNPAQDFFCQTTICIKDDDEPFVVGFVETAYTVNENVGTVNVCVNLIQPVTDILDEFVIVRVTDYPSVNHTHSNTLATPDIPTRFGTYGMISRSDYAQQTNRSNAIDDTRIEEEMRTVCYNQPIYEDGRLEEIEYFGLTLSVRQASAATDIQPMYNLATICITDNDTAVVGLEETSYTVSEDVGFVNVCAIVYSPTIDCPIEFPFSVGLSTRDGSATSMDYGALMSTILLFDTCQTKQCVLIRIEDDEINEDVENFFVSLERTTELNDRITLDPIGGEIQISDIDVAVVGLERTLYQVSEGVGYVLVCAVVFSPDENTDCPIGFAFDVELSTTDGTAVQIMDYDSLDTTLQFAECKRMSCVNITINEDETLENIESFNVTLERNGLDSSITLNPARAEIEIRDDDGPGVVGLEETFYQTAERVGTVEVCAVVYSPNGNLACPIDFAFSVELQTRDDDAVSTMDYGSITTTLPFGRCDTRSCVNVSITDDEVLENPESFSVSLQGNGLDSRITLEPTEAEIEIIDNDDAVIGLERTLYSIREGSAPTVQVCIIVYEPTGICPIAFPFSVMFSTSDGTAVVDNDYLDADTIQIFGACATRRCIFVPIVDDSIGEPDESLSISLGDPSDSRIIASPRQGLINIIDSIQVVYVNDTVTGDPLMTVPVATLPDTSTLCYEVHGEADKFFNLISDNCVSVNAHYAKAGINNPNITLNVIDAVGIRAVSNIDSCVNIRVGLEGCTASIDSVDLSGMYRGNGIMVRKYSSRVRITVPNCEDTDLVMWVFCTRGGTEDPYTWEYFSFNFLRFVVMRGLNLREESHGLLGQFWNIEIVVEEHTDLFNGASRSDDYTVTVHPNDPNDPNDPNRERSFVALESSVTWEFEKKPCLYVGNSQAGPLGEDVAPNQSVIEGSYKDYMVDSMFSPNFKFAHIDQNNCMAK